MVYKKLNIAEKLLALPEELSMPRWLHLRWTNWDLQKYSVPEYWSSSRELFSMYCHFVPGMGLLQMGNSLCVSVLCFLLDLFQKSRILCSFFQLVWRQKRYTPVLYSVTRCKTRNWSCVTSQISTIHIFLPSRETWKKQNREEIISWDVLKFLF